MSTARTLWQGATRLMLAPASFQDALRCEGVRHEYQYSMGWSSGFLCVRGMLGRNAQLR